MLLDQNTLIHTQSFIAILEKSWEFFSPGDLSFFVPVSRTGKRGER